MSLKRFHKAQQGYSGYAQAHKEIQDGQKTGHWVWYIFPQLKTLGHSSTAKLYGIKNFEEACDYLRDPMLFKRYADMVRLIEQQLHEIPLIVLMGGETDALKLTSSLTLFRAAASFLKGKKGEPQHDYKGLETCCNTIFNIIADQFYFPCESTLSFLNYTVTQPDPKNKEEKVPVPVIEQTKVKDIERTIFTPPMVQALEQYKNERKNEWEFHYNFLGIMSALYFIQDLLLGTDHFNSKNRDIKISAATKLQKIIDPTNPESDTLTEIERKALQEGRLGKLVSEHGGLDNLVQNAPEKQTAQDAPNIQFGI